jgi:hypothetical protein
MKGCKLWLKPLDECASIVLRTSAGWWTKIDRDDSGAYGFGTDIDRVGVRQGTFDFTYIYRDTRQALTETRARAEEPYIAASYYAAGSSSAREYYLLGRQQWVVRLFLTARGNVQPPANAFEAHAHDKIESIWQRNPFLAPAELRGQRKVPE